MGRVVVGRMELFGCQGTKVWVVVWCVVFMYVVKYSLSYNIVCVKDFSKKVFYTTPTVTYWKKLFQKFCIFVYGSKKLIIRRRRELYVLLRVCRLWAFVYNRFCPVKLVFLH